MRALWVLSAATLLLACGGPGGINNGGPPALADAWVPPAGDDPLYRVQDGLITTADDHVLLLRGINFSGGAKGAPRHLFEFDSTDVDKLLAHGVNSVRMLTFWKAITPAAPGVVDGAYLDAFEAQVKQLTDAGLYVVLDMHQDLWGVPFASHGAPGWACPDDVTAGYAPTGAWWTNYTTPQVTGCFDLFWSDVDLQAAYASAWAAVAERLCDEPRLVGFDLMNEPYAGSPLFDSRWDSRVLMDFYRRVMGAIEQVCPGRLYFVEHSANFVLGVGAPMEIPAALQSRVVYAGHFYPQEAHEPNGGGYSGDSTDLNERLLHYYGHHLDAGDAIWNGEYGGLSDNPNFDRLIADLHSFYAAHNISSALWDYYRGDGGFAFLDSAGQLKSVFAAVFGTPTFSRLPSRPVQTPDWSARRLTLDLDCVTDSEIEVLLPAGTCTCDATPAAALSDFDAATGFATATCLQSIPLTVSCGCPN